MKHATRRAAQLVNEDGTRTPLEGLEHVKAGQLFELAGRDGIWRALEDGKLCRDSAGDVCGGVDCEAVL